MATENIQPPQSLAEAPDGRVSSGPSLGASRPSQQKIAAALHKGGFEASRTYPSRIRGWPNRTPGFKVFKRYDDSIIVEYKSRDYGRSEREKEYLAKYLAILEPLGGKLDGDKILFA